MSDSETMRVVYDSGEVRIIVQPKCSTIGCKEPGTMHFEIQGVFQVCVHACHEHADKIRQLANGII